jgi:hypothetical protein
MLICFFITIQSEMGWVWYHFVYLQWKRTGLGLAQIVKCLPTKHKVLNSKLGCHQKKKNLNGGEQRTAYIWVRPKILRVHFGFHYWFKTDIYVLLKWQEKKILVLVVFLFPRSLPEETKLWNTAQWKCEISFYTHILLEHRFPHSDPLWMAVTTPALKWNSKILVYCYLW